MTPDVAAALSVFGLVFALGVAVALVVGLLGSLVVGWLEAVWQRHDRERRRLLLAHLYELEVACGTEFPQVRDTVAYVRRAVLAEAPVDVVGFRAGLRARYGEGVRE